jgi:N-methylhydantoinase A
VEVPVPAGNLDRTSLTALGEVFARLHLDRYGHRMADPVEVVTARLRAVGRVPRPELPLAGPGDLSLAQRGSRAVFLGGPARWVDYAVFAREHLGRGDVISGPAIIEEYTATTVVHTGDVCTVGDHGELSITIEAREQRAGRGHRR